MFPLKPKFRFPKGVSFWKRLELKEICRNVDLDVPGYRDIIAVSDKIRKEYQLQVSMGFYGDTTTFFFEHITKKPQIENS